MTDRLGDWIRRRRFGPVGLGAARGYTRHATSQLAAAIAYRVLFSLVPLAAFLVAVVDVVLPDEARKDVASWLLSVVPGRALDPSVERALTGSRVPPTAAGAVSLLVLLWSASAMMAAIRVAFRVIWENDLRRTYVQSKLLDFALVLGVGLLAVASIGATLLVQIIAEIGRDLGTAIGAGTEGRVLATAAEVLTSTILTFGSWSFCTVPSPLGSAPASGVASRSARLRRLPCSDRRLRALSRAIR